MRCGRGLRLRLPRSVFGLSLALSCVFESLSRVGSACAPLGRYSRPRKRDRAVRLGFTAWRSCVAALRYQKLHQCSLLAPVSLPGRFWGMAHDGVRLSRGAALAFGL